MVLFLGLLPSIFLPSRGLEQNNKSMTMKKSEQISYLEIISNFKTDNAVASKSLANVLVCYIEATLAL